MIGRSSKDLSTYLSGRMDDFRIYDEKLSPLKFPIASANDVFYESIDFQFNVEVEGDYEKVGNWFAQWSPFR